MVIAFELGDFLGRIPAHLLSEPTPDPRISVQFTTMELVQLINRRSGTIPLTEIRQQVPQAFRVGAIVDERIEIHFPWRKLLSLLGLESPKPQAGVNKILASMRHRAIPGAGSPTPVKTPEEQKAAAAQALRSKAEASASWFSRRSGRSEANPPGKQEPAEARGEACSSQNPVPATSAGDEVPQSLRMVLPSATPTEEPIRNVGRQVRISDLPTDIQQRVAMIRGDFERQLAEVELARKTFATEVDRLSAKLTAMERQRDADQHAIVALRQLIQQMTATQVQTEVTIREATEEVQKCHSEVSRLRGERESLWTERAQLLERISRMEGGDESEVDSLRKQVESLQEQLAVMSCTVRQAASDLAQERASRFDQAMEQLSGAGGSGEELLKHVEIARGADREEAKAPQPPESKTDCQDDTTAVRPKTAGWFRRLID